MSTEASAVIDEITLKLAASDFHKKALAGDVLAQYTLGIYYKCKKTVEDDKAAYFWLKKAAEQNHAKAQLLLGQLYKTNRGIPVEESHEAIREKLAFRWFSLAANQKNPDPESCLALSWCYRNNYGVPPEESLDSIRSKMTFKWSLMGAELGDKKAQCNLGWCYNAGYGVPENESTAEIRYQKAITWYNNSASQGYEKAAYFLARLMKKKKVPAKNTESTSSVSASASASALPALTPRGQDADRASLMQKQLKLLKAKMAEPKMSEKRSQYLPKLGPTLIKKEAQKVRNLHESISAESSPDLSPATSNATLPVISQQKL